MRRGLVWWRVLPVLVTVVLSPLIVVAGEPLSRAVRASAGGPRWNRVRQRAVATYSPGPMAHAWALRGWQRFWIVLVSNPLWIVLTAPHRWVNGQLSLYRHRGGAGPPAAGVREPRRPRPSLPGGAVALAEPRNAPVFARLLGTASRGPHRRDDRETPGPPSWRHSRHD
ncbi:MAG: hypothetical protein J2P28_07715 [Actinobacteria bacterium]|nr:hypothetical protein [Actinomycetota bacterium]MBO0835391.1 hypothetical protein [Actinomycetota bacterium]